MNCELRVIRVRKLLLFFVSKKTATKTEKAYKKLTNHFHDYNHRQLRKSRTKKFIFSFVNENVCGGILEVFSLLTFYFLNEKVSKSFSSLVFPNSSKNSYFHYKSFNKFMF